MKFHLFTGRINGFYYCLSLVLLLAVGHPASVFAQDNSDGTLPLIGEPSSSAPAADKDEKKDDNAVNAETYRQLNLFGDVFERVRAQYVEKTDDKKLIEAAINGMLTSLDPHSGFLNTEDFKDMQVQTKGEFGGLGIEVTMENGLVKVVSPIDDTPAFKAGIQAGDLIIRLDGEEVMGLTLAQAVEKMRGLVGKPIKLTVIREGKQDPFDVTLVRDTIKVRSVRSKLIGDDVGYIRITSFNEQVGAKLAENIETVKKDAGKKLKGFILDLRNNPGGLLDQAVFVSDAFLEQGEIVSTRGRNPDDTKRELATSGDLADGLPIVVLVNSGSASASEIVAGALQDHHRAIILGTKTFGKGSVQTIVSLGGSGEAMRLTTARYYTPSGRSIQATGIEPDIEVGMAKVEEIIPKYNMPKEADLHGALTNDKKPAEKTKAQDKPDAADEKNPAATEADENRQDYQLSRAADLIRGISYFNANPGIKFNTAAITDKSAEKPADVSEKEKDKKDNTKKK